MVFGEKKEIDLRVDGMTCGQCVRTVEGALSGVDGVRRVRVDLDEARAHVAYDPVRASDDDLVRAVRDAGYEARPEA